MLWRSSPIPTYQCMWYAPGMGKGTAQTLHRNYLLPISSNMGQDKTGEPEDGVENDTDLTPVPSVDSSAQSSPEQPAPVRHGIWTTRGQLSLEVSKFWVANGTLDQQTSGM